MADALPLRIDYIDLAAAFAAPPPPLDAVLPGLIAGTVGSIVAPGGAGKSMLALELGIGVACGHDLTGLLRGADAPLSTGPVLYLAAEDPPLPLRHRLYALAQHLPAAARRSLIDGLRVASLHGARPDILADRWRQGIVEMARGARLVVIDTLRRFHPHDENDSGAMAELIGTLEHVASATGSAVIFIHHAAKAAALAGQGDQQQASRGSSVLVDHVRWQLYLAAMAAKEAARLSVAPSARHTYVRVGVAKQNYGRAQAERWLLRVGGGVLTSTLAPGRSAPGRRRRAGDAAAWDDGWTDVSESAPRPRLVGRHVRA